MDQRFFSAIERAYAFKRYRQSAKDARRYEHARWCLGFDTWFEFWLESGLWDKRGAKIGQYHMERLSRDAPYALGNIVIRANAWNGGQPDGGAHFG